MRYNKNMKEHTVTCNKCKQSSRVIIDDANKKVIFKDHTPIISGRFRPDLNWGWECMCSNDSRMAPEEKDQADILVQGGSKQTINQLVKNIEKKPNTRFSLT